MATIEKRDSGDGITYRAKVRVKGHPAQSATFKRLTDARRWTQSTDGIAEFSKHRATMRRNCTLKCVI